MEAEDIDEPDGVGGGLQGPTGEKEDDRHGEGRGVSEEEEVVTEVSVEAEVTYRPAPGSALQCTKPEIVNDEDNCNKFWLCKEVPEGSGVLQVKIRPIFEYFSDCEIVQHKSLTVNGCSSDE